MVFLGKAPPQLPREVLVSSSPPMKSRLTSWKLWFSFEMSFCHLCPPSKIFVLGTLPTPRFGEHLDASAGWSSQETLLSRQGLHGFHRKSVESLTLALILSFRPRCGGCWDQETGTAEARVLHGNPQCLSQCQLGTPEGFQWMNLCQMRTRALVPMPGLSTPLWEPLFLHY